MVNLVFIYDILFISILTISVSCISISKENFLSPSHEKIDQNYLGYNTDNKLYDLIVDYRKKIFRSSLFDELVKDYNFQSETQNKTFTEYEESSIEKKLKRLENNILRSIFLQSDSKQKIEGFFNTTAFIWENLTTNGIPPSPRRGQSVVLADTLLIIFGGSDLNNKFYNDLFFFDLQTTSWIPIRQLGNIPTPRADHSAVIYGTTMWIFGGASQNGYLNDLYSFNIETKEWKKHEFAGKTPITRSGHSAVIDEQTKIYIFGGYTEKGHANDIFVINILLERYENPLTSGKPPSIREKAITFLLEKNIYIYGGHQNGIVNNDLFKLNLVNLLWEKIDVKGFKPFAYQGISGERVGKKLYVTGGCDFQAKECNKETFIFDTTINSWSKLSEEQKNNVIAQDYLKNHENNFINYSNRSQIVMQFFRGSLVSYGGCEMNLKCFNDINLLNLDEPCPNDCSGNGSCKSKIGCECKNDFILHDCSSKIKCKEDCNKNGLCRSNAKCFCFAGWKGDTCSSIIDCPKNCTSQENGICQKDTTCQCNQDFTGIDCSVNTKKSNVDPIQNLIKANAADIANAQKSLEEKFNSTIKITQPNCPNDCSGHGNCDLILKKCECQNDYKGEDCSEKEDIKITVKEAPKPINKPTPPPKRVIVQEKKWRSYWINKTFYMENEGCENKCSNKGICLNSTCLCNQGYTGQTCSNTYNDILYAGYSVKKMIPYLLIVSGTGMILTLIFNLFKG